MGHSSVVSRQHRSKADETTKSVMAGTQKKVLDTKQKVRNTPTQFAAKFPD